MDDKKYWRLTFDRWKVKLVSIIAGRYADYDNKHDEYSYNKKIANDCIEILTKNAKIIADGDFNDIRKILIDLGTNMSKDMYWFSSWSLSPHNLDEVMTMIIFDTLCNLISSNLEKTSNIVAHTYLCRAGNKLFTDDFIHDYIVVQSGFLGYDLFTWDDNIFDSIIKFYSLEKKNIYSDVKEALSKETNEFLKNTYIKWIEKADDDNRAARASKRINHVSSINKRNNEITEIKDSLAMLELDYLRGVIHLCSENDGRKKRVSDNIITVVKQHPNDSYFESMYVKQKKGYTDKIKQLEDSIEKSKKKFKEDSLEACISLPNKLDFLYLPKSFLIEHFPVTYKNMTIVEKSSNDVLSSGYFE